MRNFFRNCFKEPFDVMSSMHWSGILIPKHNRDNSLPAIISWHCLLGITCANEATIRHLEEIELSTGMDHTSYFREKTVKAKRDDHELRQYLCGSLLCCGLPLSTIKVPSSSQLDAFSIFKQLTGKDDRYQHISMSDVKTYFTEVLLPLCLRLSLHYEKGSNEPQKLQSLSNQICLLPDPMKTIDQHLLISCNFATVLLRRVNLCHAIQSILNKKTVIQDDLSSVLQDKRLKHRNNDDNIPPFDPRF